MTYGRVAARSDGEQRGRETGRRRWTDPRSSTTAPAWTPAWWSTRTGGGPSTRTPAVAPPLDSLLFVDGVRRVEGDVWLTGDGRAGRAQGPRVPRTPPARCGARTRPRCVHDRQVRARTLRRVRGAAAISDPASAASTVEFALQVGGRRRPDGAVAAAPAADGPTLGTAVASEAGGGDAGTGELTVVDGPLPSGPGRRAGSSGYVEAPTAALYRAPAVGAARWRPTSPSGGAPPAPRSIGQRPRYTRYLRLPCRGGPRLGGRGAARGADRPDPVAVESRSPADRLCPRALPGFASAPQKDTSRRRRTCIRSPGFERQLRRRLGDPAVVVPAASGWPPPRLVERAVQAVRAGAVPRSRLAAAPGAGRGQVDRGPPATGSVPGRRFGRTDRSGSMGFPRQGEAGGRRRHRRGAGVARRRRRPRRRPKGLFRDLGVLGVARAAGPRWTRRRPRSASVIVGELAELEASGAALDTSLHTGVGAGAGGAPPPPGGGAAPPPPGGGQAPPPPGGSEPPPPPGGGRAPWPRSGLRGTRRAGEVLGRR
ncbi:MAG: hypothetical protein U5R31_05685 [Acidimicrobiia bacterium]|nr:hypothetical protein [Acidimicrobiia bacterium]